MKFFNRRHVHGTGDGVRGTLALDDVELRSRQHVGRQRSIFPRLVAHQQRRGPESRIQLLFTRGQFELVRLGRLLFVVVLVLERLHELLVLTTRSSNAGRDAAPRTDRSRSYRRQTRHDQRNAHQITTKQLCDRDTVADEAPSASLTRALLPPSLPPSFTPSQFKDCRLRVGYNRRVISRDSLVRAERDLSGFGNSSRI